MLCTVTLNNCKDFWNELYVYSIYATTYLNIWIINYFTAMEHYDKTIFRSQYMPKSFFLPETAAIFNCNLKSCLVVMLDL